MWPFKKKENYEPKAVETDYSQMSRAEIFDEQIVCLERAIEIFDRLEGCETEARKSRDNLNALLQGKPFPHESLKE